jgi:hypothetical protein
MKTRLLSSFIFCVLLAVLVAPVVVAAIHKISRGA